MSIQVVVQEKSSRLVVQPNSIQVRITDSPKVVAVAKGPRGPAGAGVPVGGTTGQSLVKKSDTDFDTEWVNGGGGAVDSVNGQAGVVVLTKTDVGLGNVDNTSDANKPVSIAANRRIANIESSGLLSGGDLGINADNTKFDMTGGVGVIVDNYTDPENPTYTQVSFPAQIAVNTPLINTASTTYLFMGSDGALQFRDTQLTNVERRSMFNIGWVDHPDLATISNVKVQPNDTTDVVAQLNDFFGGFGPFNISGNEFYPATTPTNAIQRSSGETFDANANYVFDHRSPHVVITPSVPVIDLQYYYRDGAGDWFNDLTPTTAVDSSLWDNGSGTLASVPDGKWTIQIISFYSQTQQNDIQYGQVVYDDLASARSALQDPVQINPYNSYDTFRAWLIVKQGATDLSDPAQALFVSAGKLGMISVQSGGGTGGEVNTASNIGTVGVGVYDSKLGVDLRFRKINGGPLISVTYVPGTETVDISATVTKADVGLGNADNTSDANKPVSTAQATAIGLKEDAISKSTGILSWTGSAWAWLTTIAATFITEDSSHRFATDAEKTTWNAKQNALGFTPVPNTRTVAGKALSADVTLVKGDVGLGNVTNLDTSNPSNITQDATHRFATDAEKTTWNVKQDALISGSNIKTVGGTSLLGSGDIPLPGGSGGQKFTFVLSMDENVTVGADKTNTLVVPAIGTISRVTAIAKVAPVGSSLICDINKNGTSIWSATPANRIAIPSGSNSVAVQIIFDSASLAVDDLLTIDVDQVGSSVPGQEVTVTVWAV